MTDEFKQRYAKWEGIEGTLSQGIRAFDLHRARYIGLAKTHLQHIMNAVAINLTCIFAMLDGLPMQLHAHLSFRWACWCLMLASWPARIRQQYRRLEQNI